MTHLRSMLLIFLAVLALTSPSLAVGITVAAVGQVSVAVAGDADTQAYRPCEMQGGKRVLPCHPDLGLLVRASTQQLWTAAFVPRPASEVMLPDRAPKADPPPPRRS